MTVKDVLGRVTGKVGTTPMNVQRKSQTVEDLTNPPGRISAHMVRARETKGSLLITHPNWPSPSSPVNDNYCVNLLKLGLLDGSKRTLSVFSHNQDQYLQHPGHPKKRKISVPILLIVINKEN